MSPSTEGLSEEEAWAAAEQRNRELGAAGDTDRYAVARPGPRGSWEVFVTSDDPPRARWRSFKAWIRSWTSLVDGTDPRPDDPKTFDEAVRRLGATKGGDRALAVQDLARLYPEDARESIESLLADSDWRVRSTALTCLVDVVGRDAWLTCAEHLGDPELIVSSTAWRAMKRVAGRGDIAEVLTLSEAAHPKVQDAMRAWALHMDSRS